MTGYQRVLRDIDHALDEVKARVAHALLQEEERQWDKQTSLTHLTREVLKNRIARTEEIQRTLDQYCNELQTFINSNEEIRRLDVRVKSISADICLTY